MSAYYDLYETPSPKGKDGKKSLHARVCPIKTYTQEEFIKHVAAFQLLPKNQIAGALTAIIDDLCDLLADGYTVEMGDLGAESVTFQNVHLRVSSKFRKRIKHAMKFERVHSLTRKQKKITSTVEERKKRLVSFLKIDICITRKEYIRLTGLTPYEAMKELNDFISQGVLRRRGVGRSVVYVAGENLKVE